MGLGVSRGSCIRLEIPVQRCLSARLPLLLCCRSPKGGRGPGMGVSLEGLVHPQVSYCIESCIVHLVLPEVALPC